MELLNLSKEDSLQMLNLRKDEVQLLCLDKPSMNQKARVAIVLDFSLSMKKHYEDGTMQAAVERFFPIAIQFDDNGEMEVWIFHDDFYRLPNMTMSNYYGYVQREIIDKGYSYGGTRYAPVILDVCKKYEKEDPANMPNYIMFLTDGDPSDMAASEKAIKDASYKPDFWQFIGIGNTSFSFLKRLDGMGGRYVDNANFFQMSDVLQGDDKTIYEKMMNEYAGWLEYPKVKDMIAGKPVSKGFFGKMFK